MRHASVILLLALLSGRQLWRLCPVNMGFLLHDRNLYAPSLTHEIKLNPLLRLRVYFFILLCLKRAVSEDFKTTDVDTDVEKRLGH